jgi:ABC-type sugar transport system substrate-binding protein
MDRRAFIAAAASGLLAAPLAAAAQPARVPRLCVLAADSRSSWVIPIGMTHRGTSVPAHDADKNSPR